MKRSVEKIFRPATGWTTGPVGNSIALNTFFKVQLDELINDDQRESWESYMINALELSYSIVDNRLVTNALLPITTTHWSALDPDVTAPPTLFDDALTRNSTEMTVTNTLSRPWSTSRAYLPCVSAGTGVIVQPSRTKGIWYATEGGGQTVDWNGVIGSHLITGISALGLTDPNYRPGLIAKVKATITFRGNKGHA